MSDAPDTSRERYEVPIAVQAEDIDELGHVNNVVFIRWIQEAAIAHWTARASVDIQKLLAWVVARHEIDYLRPVFAEDEIVAHTWVGIAEPRAFQRHTEIRRLKDNKLVARGLTHWCPIDWNTGRPVNPPPEVWEQFSIPGPEQS